MSGYTQAIDNLAYHVQQLTLSAPEEVKTLVERSPDIDPVTLLMMLPEEDREPWYKINEIAKTIQTEYQVTAEKLDEDVAYAMLNGVLYEPR
jgi:hypothetical protein